MFLFTANVIYLRKILHFKQNLPFSTSNSNFYTFFIKYRLTKYIKCAAAFVSDVSEETKAALGFGNESYF